VLHVVQVILAVLAVYVAVCALAFWFQDRLVYFPDPHLVADPHTIGLDFEELVVTTGDGVRVHGWLVTHPAARCTILLCHGNAGNISHRLDSVRLFHAVGAQVALFDYRGYGRSSGRPSEVGTYRDAEAVWRHLVEERGLAPGEIVVFGRSLGAAVAAELAARHQPAGLILEAAFTSLPDLGAVAYPWLPVRLLARMRYDTRRRVADIACPKLIAHSVDDEIVPVRMGRAIHDAAAPPKELFLMRGDHNQAFLITGDEYTDRMRDFIENL
jgi:fermentation-respiration switch protein FrsA (DUF1100 family)